jgi:hypothetical protein
VAVERSELIEQALRETQDPPPRALRLRGFGEKPGLWLKLMLGVAVWLLLVSFLSYQFVIPFLARSFGTPAQAQVFNLWVTHGRGVSYNVRVEYLDGQKREAGTVRVSYGAYSQLHTGQSVPIHYFPFFPCDPSLDFYTPNLSMNIPMLAMLFIVLFQLGRAVGHRRLLIQGKSLKGRAQPFGSKFVDVKFEVDGREYSSRAPGFFYGGLKPEDEVVVLYDPDNPRQNRVYDPSYSLWVPSQE